MSLKSFWQHAREKIKHEAEKPHKVALGAAIGVGVSFIPLPGLGAPLSLLISWLVRASIPAALVAQIFGNPWTFPFIWAANLTVGKVISPTQEGINVSEFMNNLNWQFIINNKNDLFMNILVPLGFGGLILGFIFGFLTYALVLWEMRRLLLKQGKQEKS